MYEILIRKIRTERNLTIRELSEKCGLGTATLSRIERKEVTPNLFELIVIAKALNLKPQDLFKLTKD